MAVIASVVNKVSAPVANRLPQIDTIARTIRKVRGEMNPVPKDPEKNTEFTIPDEYTITDKGDLFLMYDSQEASNRLLIFSTQKNMEELVKSEIWASDGTFSVVPQAFAQLYTIHGNSSGQFLPLVYILTPDRSEKVYRKILRRLKIMNPNVNPKLMLVDYELGFIAAFRKVFPHCTLRGCYFHFRQAVYRKIQKCGLASDYLKDASFARDMRKLTALAIVQADHVTMAFENLVKTRFFIDHEEQLEVFLRYFESTWIGRLNRRNERNVGRYEIPMWNHHESIKTDTARTTNALEGWHNAFAGRVQVHHGSLWKFIQLLKKEQGMVEMRCEQAASGPEPPPKKRKYRDYDARLKNIVDDYDPDNIDEFLIKVANLILL